MSKNINWTQKDLKDKGLVESNGSYVPVKSLVSKKVEKIEPAFDEIDIFEGNYNIRKEEAAEQICKYFSHKNDIPFPELVKEMAQYYSPSIQKERKPGDTFLLPTGAYIDVLYRFDIVPCPAPRMTVSDKWKTDPNHSDPKKRQRKPVTKYFAFKRGLLRQADEMGYKLTETLRILVLVPMPDSWSKKKRASMLNQPHKQRGDWDNFGKGFCDCLVGEDNFVWDARVVKLWSEIGGIIIF